MISVNFKEISQIEIKKYKFKDFIIEKNWNLFIDLSRKDRSVEIYIVNIVDMTSYVEHNTNIFF